MPFEYGNDAVDLPGYSLGPDDTAVDHGAPADFHAGSLTNGCRVTADDDLLFKATLP